MLCLAAVQRRAVLYHSKWLLIVLWPWPSVHMGQLAPTTLSQCQLVSNPCSAGLSLSLAFRCVGFSLCLCVSPTLFLYVSSPPSLSVFRPVHPPTGFSLSPHPPQGCFFLFTLPTLPLCPSLPSVCATCYPTPCLLAPFRHIAVRMVVCSATCRGTVQRPPLPGLLVWRTFFETAL